MSDYSPTLHALFLQPIAREQTERLAGDRLTVTLGYGSDRESDRFEWQLFSPDEIAALGQQHGLKLLLACAGFDEAASASADVARMQLVFERE